MTKKRGYHVLPSPAGGWAVRREGADRAAGHFDRKSDAMKHARQLVHDSKSTLVEHGRDGRIRGSAAHGADSYPPGPAPKGFGALSGQFQVREGVDLSKPIYDQVSHNGKAHRVR